MPLRQWVLALPPDLHARVSRDPTLEGGLLQIFADELERLLRGTTKAFDRGRGGNVTFLQHFGSTLNLHVQREASPLRGLPYRRARRRRRARSDRGWAAGLRSGARADA